MYDFDGLIKDVEDYEKALGSKDLAVQLVGYTIIAEQLHRLPEMLAHEFVLSMKHLEGK